MSEIDFIGYVSFDACYAAYLRTESQANGGREIEFEVGSGAPGSWQMDGTNLHFLTVEVVAAEISSSGNGTFHGICRIGAGDQMRFRWVYQDGRVISLRRI